LREFTVLLATRNKGKVKELAALLADTPISVIDLTGFPELELEETGETFEENARIKAITAAKHTGFFSLADDSGLEVDALAGQPGVRSARFAHETATDEENNTLLLARLEGVPSERRTARFVSVVALASPDGVCVSRTGVAEGLIGTSPRGNGGFGYDPLFYVPEHGATYAEIPTELKNCISHRARAFLAIKEEIVKYLLGGQTFDSAACHK